MKDHWFHIDDSRTLDECKNRSDEWRPFVEKSDYVALLRQVKLLRSYIHEELLSELDQLLEQDQKCQKLQS